jgi:plasmid stabilization system protein ParE
MNYEFHPEAERELVEATFRYELDVPGLGRRFAGEVERAVEVLLKHPDIGARVDDDLRNFVLRKFPFSLVYGSTSKLLSIVAIAHGSREPGYWRSRIHDR